MSVHSIKDVDAFRWAHKRFVERCLTRCLLRSQHHRILAAIERIVELALRLRVQLEALPKLSVRAHATSAIRWRGELRAGVRLVLEELSCAASREPLTAGCGSELIDLCQLLNYNRFYG